MTIPWQVLLPQGEVTPLPPSEQAAFMRWVQRNKVADLDAPESFYDYRGAFLAGVTRGKNGHWPDTFKQHGHPTFSVESRYAIPNDPEAGNWNGETYVPHPKASQVKALRQTLMQLLSRIWGAQ